MPKDHAGPPPVDLTPSLVLRLRAGDATVGELLNRTYRQPMLRFCFGYLGSLPDAEDAVQEVFCKIIEAAGVPDNFRAWLYRVARNHCLNVIRSRERRPAQMLPSESQLDAEWTGHLTRMVREEQRSRIAQLIGSLPLAQREALRLRYAEGLSRQEIAYIVDEPESVVKSRLFEGLKRLREHDSLVEE
jgi:RNA polymerase sigma-70 factor, ECF subfamily